MALRQGYLAIAEQMRIFKRAKNVSSAVQDATDASGRMSGSRLFQKDGPTEKRAHPVRADVRERGTMS